MYVHILVVIFIHIHGPTGRYIKCYYDLLQSLAEQQTEKLKSGLNNLSDDNVYFVSSL